MRTTLIALLLAGTALGAQATPLDDGFKSPPDSAKPRVWWHWMNGNVTEEGIKLDLEWMKRVGIGGAQTFDAQLQTPQVVKNRLAYMTPEWKHAFRFAAQTADKLNLELAVAASPGWSESGGPWVAPQDGMKKVVWTETRIVGGAPFGGKLPAPPNVTGAFLDAAFVDALADPTAKHAVPTFYADTHVIAYREPADGAPLPTPRVSTAKGPIDAMSVMSDNLAIATALPAGDGGAPPWIRFDWDKAQTVRSATLGAAPAPMFGGVPYAPVLEASINGHDFHEVATFPGGLSPQYTITFPSVSAKALRIVFKPSAKAAAMFPTPPAPGANFPAFPLLAAGGGGAKLTRVAFSTAARVHDFEDKAGFAIADDYYAIPTPDVDARGAVAVSDVVNLTGKLKADGTLQWMPPAGVWRVLRMGYSLEGTTNHPATAEATGLEVDKYDADAVGRYINTYLDSYVAAAGSDLIGAHGVRAVLNDSIEAGASNWTGKLMAEFRDRRGYDATPYLPVLTGVIVGAPDKSDAFLYDYRKTLGELIAENHYAKITDEVHKRGLIHYGEADESGRATLGDDMDLRKSNDVPMAAMWSFSRDKTGPQTDYWADDRGAASVAHIYGQNLVAAESLTAFLSPWAFSPRDLQPMIDAEFANGINRPVIHTSVHQPLTDHAPGFSLFIFGQYFNRLDTWAEQATPWVSYMSRNAYMLQKGRFVADVAYFYGEEAPLTGLYHTAIATDVPTGSGFDFASGSVVLHELSNDGADLVAKSGARYRVLYLGGSSSRMTLPVLTRINALVQAGATVVGDRPVGTPSLADDRAAFDKIADSLWGGQTGKGKVIAGHDVDAALASLNVAPDFGSSKPEADADLQFVHRKTADAEIYYFSNRRDRAETLDLKFRVTGKTPEYWDAATGTSRRLSYRTEGPQTVIPMALIPLQSGFVVFREATTATSATVPTPVDTVLTTLDGPWTLSFQAGRGAPNRAASVALGDWSKSADPGVKYFSGTASYARTLDVKSAWLKSGGKLVLDLGEVRELAEVLINGKSAGIAWKAPYRVDLTGLTKSGKNALEIRVTNLWVNRLVGDAQPGATKVGYTTYQMYTAGAPLRTSGLMGPVEMVGER